MSVEAQRVPKRKSVNPTSRIAGRPEMIRYTVISRTKAMAMKPQTRNTIIIISSMASLARRAPPPGTPGCSFFIVLNLFL